MALIEFKCTACGELFEEFIGMNDPRDRMKCPKCGKHAVQNFNGKMYGQCGKSGGCSGYCKNCSGCH